MTPCPACLSPLLGSETACPSCGVPVGGPQWHGTLAPGSLLRTTYRIESVLGQGGFGITYRALHQTLQMPVAIKELFPEGSVRSGTTIRPSNSLGGGEWALVKKAFIEEGRMLARFTHPGIVRVQDVFEENGTAYLVMELLTGETLASKLERLGSLDVDSVHRLALVLCGAMEVIHAAGLLHRDIKPDNVLLTKDGRTVLIDFGSAREFRAGHTERHTRTLTPGYAPYEQYATEARFGPYTDIYALAATLYHAVTGKKPMSAPDRVMAGSAGDLVLSTGITASLVNAISQGLKIRIEDRPQTAAEFRAFLSGAARSAPPPPLRIVPPPLPQPAPTPPPAVVSHLPRPAAPVPTPSRGPSPQSAASKSAPVSFPSPPVSGNTTSGSPARGAWRWFLVAGGLALIVLMLLVRSGRETVPAEPPIVPTHPGASPTVPTIAPTIPAAAPTVPAVVPTVFEGAGIRWVTIPAGSFTMGCTSGDADCPDDEKPPHRVTLTKSFEMAATETTNGQYRACVDAGACAPPTDRTAFDDTSRNDHPVVYVSWDDAVRFCEWAGGRLPTEAEWEYAARGGRDGVLYVWGDEGRPSAQGQNMANVGDESTKRSHPNWRVLEGYDDGFAGTAPVGSFPANGFGLFDMAGNAWEWCGDWYDTGYFGRSPAEDPQGPSSGTGRVVRGGSWSFNLQNLRLSNRDWNVPTYRQGGGGGFRAVRDALSP